MLYTKPLIIKTMKTFYTFILLFFSLALLAQKGHECKHKEQIKAQKVAFLTQKLDLSVNEAQQFWPLYNEYEKKREELLNQEKDILKKMDNPETLSDKELTELADNYITIEQNQAKLAFDYHNKFKKVLPPKKLLILYNSEKLFKRELLRQLRQCPAEREK